MRIRSWLTGLIVFLLAPCLLFASLWFYEKFESVRKIERSQEGLRLISSLGVLMERKSISGETGKPPQDLETDLAAFGGPDLGDLFAEKFREFMSEGSPSKSLRNARQLTIAIGEFGGLTSSMPLEAIPLPHLLTDVLPLVVIESSRMRDNAVLLSSRETINVWDKMLIPVQGGQFKVAADGVSRETIDHLKDLSGPAAEILQQKSKRYREANVAFQAQGAKLLTSTINAHTGRDIQSAPVIEAQPKLVHATISLWQEILTYMDETLAARRAVTLQAVTWAGAAGFAIIVIAFGIGAALSRTLADRTQKEFEKLGFHDPLTGLPNRRALLKVLKAMPAYDGNRPAGLIVFDIHQFRKINHRHGDQSGDSILRAVAEDLTMLAEPEDYLSRTGGSEFVLFRPSVDNAIAFEKFAQQTVKRLCKDRRIDDQDAMLDVNAGLSLHKSSAPLNETFLTDATLALRAAKKKGPKELAIFTPDMRALFESNSQTAKELLPALQNGHIVPWFQPQVDIHTGEIVGAEALARWVDKETVRFPGAFLPAAEDAGYMELIETAVRDKVLALATTLNDQNTQNIHLGLNLSASVLGQENVADQIYQKITELGLTPSNFSLEILEAVMIDDSAALPVKENIAKLSDYGFFIELDDFGTGHSSISSLRDLQVDRVKIDRSFVSGVDTNPDLQKFTSALINLARSLDISILAEGVETEGERLWLQAHGCDVIQGFLISKAVPEDQFLKMITRQSHLRSNDGAHAIGA